MWVREVAGVANLGVEAGRRGYNTIARIFLTKNAILTYITNIRRHRSTQIWQVLDLPLT